MGATEKIKLHMARRARLFEAIFISSYEGRPTGQIHLYIIADINSVHHLLLVQVLTGKDSRSFYIFAPATQTRAL